MTMVIDERGSDGVTIAMYRAIILKNAILYYTRTGMKVNHQYAPTNMQRTVENITKIRFKRFDWRAMIEELDKFVRDNRPSCE